MEYLDQETRLPKEEHASRKDTSETAPGAVSPNPKPTPDLTGRRFGELTVLGPAPDGRWLCRCTCGWEGRRAESGLLSGQSIRCNPSHHLVRDIQGKQFGRLTAEKYVGRIEGRHSWQCTCACGQRITVQQDRLLHGLQKSCGCGRRRASLVGERFGRLTVTEDLGIKGKNHLWGCQCDCSKTCVATQTHLLRGQTKSCGCLRDSIGKKNLKLAAGTSVTKLEKRRGKVSAKNTSGYTGVYAQNSCGKKNGRWAASIGFRGKRYFLGSFDTFQEAVQARKDAEERLYGGFLKWYYEQNPEEKPQEDPQEDLPETDRTLP